MKNKPLFLLPLLFWLFTACDKKTPDPGCETVSESPQAFLDYWYFPEGSWWVYELKGSPGVYDTVRVTEQWSTFSKPCKKDCNPDYFSCTMTYFTTLNHSNKNYFKTFVLTYPANEGLVAQGGGLRVFLNLKDNFLPHNTDIFVYPVTIGMKLSENLIVSDTNKVATPLKTFDKTVHIKVIITNKTDSTSLGNFSKSLFFTKHVGLTKRVYTGNQTWALVNYHINK